MTRKSKFCLFLIVIMLMMFSLTLTACGKTEYKLDAYMYYDETYKLGDEFYNLTLEKDMVIAKLNNGEVELKISKSFLIGSNIYNDEYITYNGTYTETNAEINALIPDFSSEVITITKTGRKILFKLSINRSIILSK